MKVSDYIVEWLISKNVRYVFGYQGGMITHLVDSLYKYSQIKFIQNHHEQASAFSAEGYARMSGGLGVAMATSGPGATNLLTGICSAYFDSVPCLYITGQVNTYEYKTSKTRQQGFQETDIVAMAEPITKYSYMLKDGDDVHYYLEKAFEIATSGRCGPVLLDIPMNIQRLEIENKLTQNTKKPSKSIDLLSILEMISESTRPVVLAGGGIRTAGAVEGFREFIKKFNLPVVTSLMGLDSIDHLDDQFAGFIGAYGSRYGNYTLANADLVIILGSRLTYRQTGTLVDSFARAAKFIRVDIDSDELDKQFKDSVNICCNVKDFFESINTFSINKKDFSNWYSKIDSWKKAYKFVTYHKQQLDPNEFISKLSVAITDQCVVIPDVGQNQMWAAQSFQLKEKDRFITSGGMGAMGFSLPTAIGVAMDTCAIVISIVGDGGFQMNIQELQTVRYHNLPIKIILMDNKSLGMIRQFQEMYFDAKYHATLDDYSNPNFENIAFAYGIGYKKVTSIDDIDSIVELFNNSEPFIFHVCLSNQTYVLPKLAVGRPIEDQEPLLDRDEFNRNMII